MTVTALERTILEAATRAFVLVDEATAAGHFAVRRSIHIQDWGVTMWEVRMADAHHTSVDQEEFLHAQDRLHIGGAAPGGTAVRNRTRPPLHSRHGRTYRAVRDRQQRFFSRKQAFFFTTIK